MKKTMKTKVFASLIAAVCAISAITTVSVISDSAYNDNNPLVSSTYIITAKTYGNTFVMPMKGEDWTYYADSLNVKVSCDYDYSTNTCHFKFTAVKPGVVNVVLKTQNVDGTWLNTPVRITVEDDLTMKIIGTDSPYTTEKSYTTEKTTTETSAPEKTGTTEKTVTPEKTADTTTTKAGFARFSVAGEDWNYYIDSLNVKVSCDYDYSTNTCNFKFTAVKPGTANAVLKAQTKDGKWMNIPVCITVDDNMQVSFYQSGDTYMTA